MVIRQGVSITWLSKWQEMLTFYGRLGTESRGWPREWLLKMPRLKPLGCSESHEQNQG